MIMVTPEIHAVSDAALAALVSLDSLECATSSNGLASAATHQLREALAETVSSIHRCQITEHVLTERETREAQAA